MTVRVIWQDDTGRELFDLPPWAVDAEALGSLLTALTRLGVGVTAEAETPDAVTIVCRGHVPRGTVSRNDVGLRH